MYKLPNRTLFSIRALCFMAIIAGSLLASSTANASSETRMALFEIVNDSKSTLNYYVKWGKNGSWVSSSLKPGEKMFHWWEYTYVGENQSPRPYVRFDADMTKGVQWEQRWAQAYASPEADSKYSKKYVFQVVGEVLNILQA